METDKSIIDDFVIESKEHLSDIENDFLTLEKQKDDLDQDRVNKIYRALHSIKGASGFLGLDNVNNLSHIMETLLSKIRTGEMKPDSIFISALLLGVDQIKSMMDDIHNSNKMDINLLLDTLNGYLAEQQKSPEKIKQQEIDEKKEKPTAAPPEPAAKKKEPEQNKTEPIKSPPKSEKKGDSSFKQRETIRINVDILDRLIRLAGELVLVRNQQLLSLEKSEPIHPHTAQKLNSVTSELQESIMFTRMQPIGSLFVRFSRIVYNLSKSLNKEIEISFSGSKVEVDKTILEALADPLTHIIRNCCDHGIESPEVRNSVGKSEIGQIVVEAFHESGQINIKITDDGKGIDPKKISEKALANGFKSEEELQKMGEKEILSLIFLPGFSTNEKITDVSGRGVGMDVVKSNIEKHGGVADISSELGKNTVLNLRLPLTLAIIPCLIVMSGEYRYAIPQINIEELVCLYDDEVRTRIECAKNREVYRLRDHLLFMVRLEEVLKQPNTFTDEICAEITERYRKKYADAYSENIENRGDGDELEQSLNFAVLKIGNTRFGLIIDHIIGTEEIVVKPMHNAVKDLILYAGSTILGDGKVALILDVLGLARHSGAILESYKTDSEKSGKERGDYQEFILFKNGEKEQFAIAPPLIRRIEQIATSQIEHVGGKEYITIDGVSILIFRLDEYLNISQLEKKEDMFLMLPKHTDKKFGILASQLIDIGSYPINIDVDGYMEDGLLGTTIIEEHMTLLLDMFRLVEKAEPAWFEERKRNHPHPQKITNILLVEDQPYFRQLVKRYLMSDEYNVVTAINGEEGLNRLSETEFDIIISDTNMPEMDGWKFIKNVRNEKSRQNIPAIVLAEIVSEINEEKAKKFGFDRYNIKFDRESLLSSVSELLL